MNIKCVENWKIKVLEKRKSLKLLSHTPTSIHSPLCLPTSLVLAWTFKQDGWDFIVVFRSPFCLNFHRTKNRPFFVSVNENSKGFKGSFITQTAKKNESLGREDPEKGCKKDMNMRVFWACKLFSHFLYKKENCCCLVILDRKKNFC